MNNNQSTLDRLGKVKAPYLPYVKDHVENEFGDYIYWSKQKLPDIDIPIEKDPVPEIAKCELSINNQSVKVTANTNVLNNQYLIQTEQHNHTTINNTVNKTSTTNQYIQINNNPQNDTDLELERLKLKYLQKELLEEKQKLLTTNNRNEELIINLNKKIDSIKSGNGDHQTIVINQNTIHQSSNNQNVLLNTNEYNHAESRVMNNYTGVNFNTQNGHQVYSQQERVAAERYPNFSRDVILSNENFNQTVSNHACNYSGIDFNEQNKLQIHIQHDRMQIPITERSYGSGKDIPVSCGNLPDVRKAYQIPPSNTPLPTPDPQRSGLKHEAHYDDSQRLGLEYESYQDKVISANQPILPGASRIEKNNAGDKIQQIKENKRVPNVDRIEVFSGKGYNPIPSSNATQNRKVNILQLEKSFKSNNTVFSADEVDSTNREKILEKNTPYWKYLQVFRAVVFTAHSFYTTYPGISNPLVIQLGGQHLLIALLISNVIDLVVTIVKAWPKTFWCCWDTENWDSIKYLRSIWSLIADHELLLDLIPLLANFLLRIYSYRFTELMKNPQVQNSIIDAQYNLSQWNDPQFQNFAQLLMWGISIGFTILFHTLHRVYYIAIHYKSPWLGIVFGIKALLFLLDIVSSSLLLYTFLVSLGTNIFGTSSNVPWMLSVIIPSPLIASIGNSLINVPLLYFYETMNSSKGRIDALKLSFKKVFSPVTSLFSLAAMYYIGVIIYMLWQLQLIAPPSIETLNSFLTLNSKLFIVILVGFNLLCNYLVGVVFTVIFWISTYAISIGKQCNGFCKE